MVITNLKGIHRYRKKLTSGIYRYYYKVSREPRSPVFWTRDYAPEPEPVKKSFVDAYHKAKNKWRGKNECVPGTLNAIIAEFRLEDEFKKLRRSTRNGYEECFPEIRDEFGPDELELFEDRRTRKLIKQWRDQWSDTPRQADKMKGTLVRILNYAVDQGEITLHVAGGIKNLYKKPDRSEDLWTPEDIESFSSAASRPLRWF